MSAMVRLVPTPTQPANHRREQHAKRKCSTTAGESIARTEMALLENSSTELWDTTSSHLTSSRFGHIW